MVVFIILVRKTKVYSKITENYFSFTYIQWVIFNLVIDSLLVDLTINSVSGKIQKVIKTVSVSTSLQINEGAK